MAGNEKLFTLKEVLEIVSKTNAIAAQDLVDATEGKEFTDSKTLLDVINPIAVKGRNDLIQNQFDKAKGKISKKVEKRLSELFPDGDFDGKDVDTILETLPTIVKPATQNNSTKISTEQAMQHPDVKNLVAKLQKDSDELKTVKENFDSYKSTQKVLQKAIAEAEKQGAAFSADPVIRARQIKAFEAELTRFKYKEDDKGNLIPLDDEGEHPRHNTTTGKNWEFSDFVKDLSPVDFKTEQQQNQQNNKNIPIPENGGGVQNFGFSAADLKTIGEREYRQALEVDKNLSKAEFIKQTIIKRAEQA